MKSTLATWNPFRDFETITNRLLSPNLGVVGTCPAPSQRTFAPAVDVTEDETRYLIAADLPDMQKSALKVTVENNVLTFKGERSSETKTEKAKVHLVERTYGSFARSFQLPDDADGSSVTATYKDGVLTISVPKKAEAKPKSIEVAIE